jgi:hypothetical protein
MKENRILFWLALFFICLDTGGIHWFMGIMFFRYMRGTKD